MDPLLSIVIPTRDRPNYLMASLEVITSYCPLAEVIVCDNSVDDCLRNKLGKFASFNIKYVYSSETLSVVDNFERARKSASGEYLLFLGDDDSIGPGLYQVAEWSSQNHIDAVISYGDTFLANYFWPGVQSKYYGSKYSGRMFVAGFTGKATRLDPLLAMRASATNPGSGLGFMPRAYHGLVSKALLDQIDSSYGYVFGGVSPDIFSAILISSVASNCWRIDYPFVIPGASPKSTAGQGAERSDSGSLNAVDHITRFGKSLVWDQLIPEFYSPHTVWAISMTKALDLVNDEGVIINYPRLYAKCLIHQYSHKHEVLKALRIWAQKVGIPIAILRFACAFSIELLYLAKRYGKRLINPRPFGGADQYCELTTIIEAYKKLDQHISIMGPRLELPESLPSCLVSRQYSV